MQNCWWVYPEHGLPGIPESTAMMISGNEASARLGASEHVSSLDVEIVSAVLVTLVQDGLVSVQDMRATGEDLIRELTGNPVIAPEAIDRVVGDTNQMLATAARKHALHLVEDEAYEICFFAEKHGLSLEAADDILSSNGPSRLACDTAAIAFVAAVAQRNKQWQRDLD